MSEWCERKREASSPVLYTSLYSLIVRLTEGCCCDFFDAELESLGLASAVEGAELTESTEVSEA